MELKDFEGVGWNGLTNIDPVREADYSADKQVVDSEDRKDTINRRVLPSNKALDGDAEGVLNGLQCYAAARSALSLDRWKQHFSTDPIIQNFELRYRNLNASEEYKSTREG